MAWQRSKHSPSLYCDHGDQKPLSLLLPSSSRSQRLSFSINLPLYSWKSSSLPLTLEHTQARCRTMKSELVLLLTTYKRRRGGSIIKEVHIPHLSFVHCLHGYFSERNARTAMPIYSPTLQAIVSS